MVMKFCKKCGGPLRSQKIDEALSYLFCDKCHDFELLKEGKKVDFVVREKMEASEKIGGGVSKDENKMATYDNICEKCGYDKAEVIDLGQFYSDEDNMYLMKCGKCGWAERIGKGT
jgi:DNA-directed RNA polymerase subunit M/transcription elongation factor TFIIS